MRNINEWVNEDTTTCKSYKTKLNAMRAVSQLGIADFDGMSSVTYSFIKRDDDRYVIVFHLSEKNAYLAIGLANKGFYAQVI